MLQILFRPKEGWAQIATEPGGIVQAIVPYGIVMTLLPVLAGMALTAVFTIGASFLSAFLTKGQTVSYLPMLVSSAVTGAMIFAGITAMQVLLAGLMTLIAPHLGGRTNWALATRLLVYAATPLAVTGLFAIIPVVGWLAFVLGIVHYVYVFYLGLDPLFAMKDPAKRIIMMVVTFFVALAFGIVFTGVSAFASAKLVNPLTLNTVASDSTGTPEEIEAHAAAMRGDYEKALKAIAPEIEAMRKAAETAEAEAKAAGYEVPKEVVGE
jgi:hypothetical protein